MTEKEMVSLREYIDVRIAEMDKRFSAIDRSVDLASTGIDRRLEGMNEFREQLRTQAATFITQAEIEAKLLVANATHAQYELRLEALEKGLANIQGKLWVAGAAVTVCATALSAIVSVALHFLK